MLSDKKGDNAQVEIIEKALPWNCVRKHVAMREPFVFGKPRVGATLYHVDLTKSDELSPPWPDLILTIGRRPANVALWVREQSGGHTRIVLVGKPSGMPYPFDLVIHSAEIQLPPLKNVQAISLPLLRVDEEAVATAAGFWETRLADLPRPLIAFLVGGPTGPYVFDGHAVDRLLGEIDRVVSESGGTPYITTSRRTPPAVVETIRGRLPSAARLFEWSADSGQNPYLGLLGLADGFVVTGDSISMMVEVARLRKPLAIFPLSVGRLGAVDQWRRSAASWLFRPPDPAGYSPRSGLARLLYRLRIITHTRDFTAFHDRLVNEGLASYAGEALRPPSGDVPDDLSIVVRRITGLIQG